MKPSLTIQMNIPVNVQREGTDFFARCDISDIINVSSNAKTKKEALDILTEKAASILYSYYEDETLNEVLKDMGFRLSFSIKEPVEISDDYESIRISIPFLVNPKKIRREEDTLETALPTMEEAKINIKQYFEDHHGTVINYGDLLDLFDYPLGFLVDVCEELEKEGQIAAVNSKEEPTTLNKVSAMLSKAK